MNHPTIVAVATPPGRGGVGMVRLSGPKSLAIAQQLTKLRDIKPRYAYYASFFDGKGEMIDQGILIYYKAPHSFTGEDVVEFQAHGSPIVLDRLVKVSIHAGAELAKPGAFSERAFLNDKMDLAQAEAIADLIHAHSETAAKMAVQSLQGVFSDQVTAVNEKITHLRMFVEAAIDFPEEDIDFISDGKVAQQLQDIISDLSMLISGSQQGVILQEGLHVVIAGRPNAGKSTLINRIAGREVAIVTEIAGTTRDVMREHLLLDDIPIHLVDTAGLHESEDVVEKEGMRRTREAIKTADLVLLVMDASVGEHPTALDEEVRELLPENTPILLISNKIDKIKRHSKTPTCHGLSVASKDRMDTADKPRYVGDKNSTLSDIQISAKTGENIDLLKEKIKTLVGYPQQEGTFLARRRHLDALNKAHEHLLTGQTQLTQHKAGELLAEDLRLAHRNLCEITGEFTSDDLLGEIFSSFCIGK